MIGVTITAVVCVAVLAMLLFAPSLPSRKPAPLLSEHRRRPDVEDALADACTPRWVKPRSKSWRTIRREERGR